MAVFKSQSPAPPDYGEASGSRNISPPVDGDDATQRRIKLLEGQNDVLGCIAKGAGVAMSLGRLASVLEQNIDSAFCAVMLFDSAGDLLSALDTPTLPIEFGKKLRQVETSPGIMPCATAAYRHEPLIVADLAADLGWPEFREAVMAEGLRACWSQPILSQDGETLGTLGMYHREPKLPSEHELSVLDSLCPIARIAIEHDRRGQDLHQADERLTSLAQNLPGVVYQRVVDPDGEIRYTYISEGARDLWGVSPEQVIADPQAVFDRHGPEYRATFRENLLQASRDLTMWDVEAPIITQDGEHKWGHAIAKPISGPPGLR